MLPIKRDVKKVRWSELTRAKEDGLASVCPACKEGMLLVARNSETLEIQAIDNCTLCGQFYEYEDVEFLRHKAAW
jgi:uncharacterized protein (DUF983 family)